MVETMLYCSNCGGPVTPSDAFCGKCGTRQPGAAAPGASAPPPGTSLRNLGDSFSPTTAATLCYVPWVGWLMALVVLATERFRRERDARFHAFQGLYLFVAWQIVDRVLVPIFRYGPLSGIAWPLRLAVFGAAIFMLVKASQGERFKLPLLGDLAEKSANEQN